MTLLLPNFFSNLTLTLKYFFSEDCPKNENEVGDLRVTKNGKTVACLSPCKKWNYPPPYGLGKP